MTDVGFFADERGATSVAAVVAVLVSLVLVFGLANVQWSTSTAADVQAVADAGALAGANIVASYATVAQILDALVLSLGLVGMLTFAIGLVMSALPVVNVAAPPVLGAAESVLDARLRLATSGARGLQKLEEAIPYIVAANSFVTVRANKTHEVSYVGLAVPYPLEGESNFGLLGLDDMAEKVGSLKERGEEIDRITEQASEYKKLADEALERGWRADCGDNPSMRERAGVLAGLSGAEIDRITEQASEYKKLADEALERGWRADCGDNPSMRERAGVLAGLSGALNPSYLTSASWSFGVPILRARSYCQHRLANEVPLDSSVEEAVRSEARKAFYRYALSEVNQSSYVVYADGSVVCDLRSLPANTQDMRGTSLYTERSWPTTAEATGATVHAFLGCPGATGALIGYSSVAEMEQGTAAECGVCQFNVVSLGRAPAASSAISNGFEYHWALVVDAARDFEGWKDEQLCSERDAREISEEATDLFAEALERLTATRVKLAPPGRYGCICVVADPANVSVPDGLARLFVRGAVLPPRAAIAGAALARDGAESGNNVLASFFDGLVAKGGLVGGTSSVLDGVMTVWGDALLGYGDAYAAFTSAADSAFRGLSALGMGGVSSWLQEALRGVMSLAAIEPADMSLKKPVLVNTVDIMNRAGNNWYIGIQSLVSAVQTLDEGSGPIEVAGALGFVLKNLTGSDSLRIAEIGIPGTNLTIPLEIDLNWLAGLGSAA